MPERRNEAAIVHKIQKEFRKRGAFVEKLHGGIMQRAGLPDLIVCFRGTFLGIEVKDGKNTTTPLQDQVLQEIRDAEGIAAVCYSVEEALALLNAVESIHAQRR